MGAQEYSRRGIRIPEYVHALLPDSVPVSTRQCYSQFRAIMYPMKVIVVLLTVTLFLGLPLTAQVPGSLRDTILYPFFDTPGVPLVGASSFLEESGSSWQKYHMMNLFDRSDKTAWVEGVPGTGVEEQIWFAIPSHVSALTIINGYAASERLFRANARVKTLRVSLHAGCTMDGMVSETGPVFESIRISGDRDIEIRDSREVQSFPLNFSWDEASRLAKRYRDKLVKNGMDVSKTVFFIVAEIRAVYPGEKWEDTCIAEIDWTYEAGHHGPEGIRHTDLAGQLYVETGAEWDTIVFDDDAFIHRYESYKDEELYDTGVWTFVNGTLIMESDGRIMTRQYDRITIDGCSIIFVDDEGNEIRYRRGA